MDIFSYIRTAAVIGIVSLLAACAPEQHSSDAAPLTAVTVAPVIHQSLTEWDEFTGRLQAPERVELRPRVAGYIANVAYQEGALVNAGDLLFIIDDAPFKAEVDRLQAEAANAQSRFELAQAEYRRAKALSRKGAISDEVVDNRLAQFRQTGASVKSVAAALQLARLDLGYTRVTAPINGRVSNAQVTRGNYVHAGQSLLTTIVSTDKVYAYFDADEQAYLKYARLAQEGSRPSSRDVQTPVLLALAGEEGYPHEGYIDFVDNQVDPATGTIRGRAVFENRDHLFIPGLFARIKLMGSATYRGILIDDKAVGTDLNNKYVLVVNADSVVEYRAITLGEKLAGLRIIKTGLAPNDRVVINGLQRVRPGTAVNAQEVAMGNAESLQQLRTQQARVDRLTGQSLYAGRNGKPVLTAVGG